MPTKIDYRRELKTLYQPSSKNPVILEIPEMNFLKLDGEGDPSSEGFAKAIAALYALAYPVKFSVRKSQDIDYGVMPLEGLWWADDMQAFTSQYDRNSWKWTLMIMQPEYVNTDIVEETRLVAQKKKDLPEIAQVRFESYNEGDSVQLMHMGPYTDEGPNIIRLHTFAQDQGFHLSGLHHEIYLNDFRKTAPQRLKTVLRQPVSK